jgi:hypothetical protein
MKGVSMRCLACQGVWWQTFGAHSCPWCQSDRILPVHNRTAAS